MTDQAKTSAKSIIDIVLSAILFLVTIFSSALAIRTWSEFKL